MEFSNRRQTLVSAVSDRQLSSELAGAAGLSHDNQASSLLAEWLPGYLQGNPALPGLSMQPRQGAAISPFTLAAENIPTLALGQGASTTYDPAYLTSSRQAQLVDQNRQSIVEIVGPAKEAPGTDYVGSGFFVDGHGDIATALHVVRDDSSIQVITSDGKEHSARVVSENPATDLAIVSIGADQKTQPVRLAPNSDSLNGKAVLDGLGHPDGRPQLYLSPGTFSKLVTSNDVPVSGLNGVNPQQNLIQADMNVAGGDSGGPLFNDKGQVVGILDRGDGGQSGDSVSVDDLWPMLTAAMRKDQAAAPALPAVLPSRLHIGSSTVIDATAAAALGWSFLRGSGSRLGPAVNGLGGIFAAKDLLSSDLPFFKTAMSNGPAPEKVDAALNVGSDSLMIAGAVASFVPQWRTAATAVELAGGLIKFGNQLAAFRRYS